MADNTMTPLWLDIKKEYIDENFDAVVSYLHKHIGETSLQDNFYRTTVNLLQERMLAMVESVAAAPLQEDMCKDEDLKLICRMCGLYMLVFQKDSELRRNAYSLMLQSLLLIVHQGESELAELAVDIIAAVRLGRHKEFQWPRAGTQDNRRLSARHRTG